MGIVFCQKGTLSGFDVIKNFKCIQSGIQPIYESL
jgi:hypothetical protein